MIETGQFLLIILVPGVFVWGSFFLMPRFGFSSRTEVAAGLGIAAALFGLRWFDEWKSLPADVRTLGTSFQEGLQRFSPPKESGDWLAVAVLLGAALVALDHQLRRSRGFVGIWGLFIGLFLWRFLLGSIYLSGESPGKTYFEMVAFGVVGSMAAGLLGWGNRDIQDRSFLKRILLTIVIWVSAVVALTSGSVAGGVIGMAIGAAAGHVCLASLLTQSSRSSPMSSGFWVMILTLYLLNGIYFSEITMVNSGLLLGSVASIGLIEFRFKSPRFSNGLAVAVSIAVLVLTGLAGGFSIQKALEDMQQKTDDPYSQLY